MGTTNQYLLKYVLDWQTRRFSEQYHHRELTHESRNNIYLDPIRRHFCAASFTYSEHCSARSLSMAHNASDSGRVDSLPLPNDLHSAPGAGVRPSVVVMANGLKKRLFRTSAAPSDVAPPAPGAKWWKTRLFHGMINDVRRRAPYYLSDWKDAWDYRVIPATVYMYFAKYEPHLTCHRIQEYKSGDTCLSKPCSSPGLI